MGKSIEEQKAELQFLRNQRLREQEKVDIARQIKEEKRMLREAKSESSLFGKTIRGLKTVADEYDKRFPVKKLKKEDRDGFF